MGAAWRDAGPAFGVSLAGLGLLAGLMLAPPPGAAVVGLVFPPWVRSAAAAEHVAALSVPIVDIRWGGRLVLVAPPDPPPGVSEWRRGLPPGVLVLATSGSLCARPARPAEATFPLRHGARHDRTV